MSLLHTIWVVLLLTVASTINAHPRHVPAMYVFGDSTADVGNNNYLPGNASTKANFKFNGIDYPGGVSTGRFSNGFNGIDYTAKNIGFEKSPPAALSIVLPIQEAYGVNFASGASGIFDSTGAGVSLSMNTQINLFEGVRSRLISSRGKIGARLFLSRSLFIFSTGNNDMFLYFSDIGAQSRTLNAQFISSLAQQFRTQLMRLYNLGARKFAFFGNGLVGCTPAFRALSPSYDCVEPLNDLSRCFNRATKQMLLDLKSTLPGMKYSFAETYEVAMSIKANPIKFGFEELRAACCGVGVLNAEAPCTPIAAYCPNRNVYLNWDYAHPTQAGYEIFADYAYNASSPFTVPINFYLLSLL